jgi:hypothetical protein
MAKPNPKLPELTPQDIQRFWSKVDKSPGQGPKGKCWGWKGHIMKGGYGVFSASSKTLKAHRIAYFIHNHIDPGPLLVCHECDWPPCCNPADLFIGSYADNRADCDSKGRTGRACGDKSGARTKPHRIARGERQGHSLLTTEQVLAIRSEYATGTITQKELGLKFKVSRSAIKMIVNRTNWKHVE